MRRPQSLAALVAILSVLVLAGCGSTPNRSDAAAVVGDHVITIDQVQQELRSVAPQLQSALDQQAVQTGQAPGAPVPPDLLAAQSRRLLSNAIFHELLGEQAQRDGVQVDPRQVDAVMSRVVAGAPLSGSDQATLRQTVSDQLLAVQLGRSVFDRLAVTVDYANLPNRAAADAFAARVAADPGRSAQLYAALPSGTALPGLAARPGSSVDGQGGAPPVVFGLPEGSVAVVPASSSSSSSPEADPSSQPWSVVHIVSRTLNAPPGGPGVTPAAAADEQTLITIGVRAVQPLAIAEGVTVNPRYGTWDPGDLAIANTPGAAGTVLTAPSPAS